MDLVSWYDPYLVHGWYSSGIEEYSLSECRLARIDVSSNTNIPDPAHVLLEYKVQAFDNNIHISQNNLKQTQCQAVEALLNTHSKGRIYYSALYSVIVL